MDESDEILVHQDKPQIIELQIFPFDFTVVFTEKAWEYLVKHRSPTPNLPFPPVEDTGIAGQAQIWQHDRIGNEHSLIVISVDLPRHNGNYIELLKTFVHEVTHAVDFVFQRIGEGSPGAETRCYLTEYLFGICVEQHAFGVQRLGANKGKANARNRSNKRN